MCGYPTLKTITCTVCGRKGAKVRPDFDWNTQLRSKTMREAFTRAINPGQAMPKPDAE